MPFARPCLKRHLTVWQATHEQIARAPGSERTLVFHYGREHGIVLDEVDDAQLLLLSLLDGTHRFEELVARLQVYDARITAEDVAETLEQLREGGIIEDTAVRPPDGLTQGDLERYGSQILCFSALDASGVEKYEMQARLKRARVTILGLGGLGSNVALGLAAAGVGYLRGVDFDTVEQANLNRQVLYDADNLGQPKAQAAAEQIRRFNPQIEFEPVQQRIEGPDALAELIVGSDLVALCADSPAEMPNWMNAVALRTHIPFLGGSYNAAVVDVGPFVVPHMTSCLECNQVARHVVPDALAWTRDPAWQLHPNIHFVIATSANLVCSEMIKHLTGFSRPMTYNRRYLLSFTRFTLEPLDLPRDEGCAACGTGTTRRGAGREGCVTCGDAADPDAMQQTEGATAASAATRRE